MVGTEQRIENTQNGIVRELVKLKASYCVKRKRRKIFSDGSFVVAEMIKFIVMCASRRRTHKRVRVASNEIAPRSIQNGHRCAPVSACAFDIDD